MIGEEATMWSKIVPALLGGLLGTVLTLATVGWSEGEKLAQLHRAKALAEFAEAAWGPDPVLYDRKVSSLTVYASPEVIRAHATWVQMHCNDTDMSKAPKCQNAWAEVISAMRNEIGMPPVNNQDIIDAIWEKPQSIN